jgi:hypothetical protein
MAETMKNLTVPEWHEAIAEKSGATAAEVENILSELGIRPQPLLPRARTVNVTSVRLQGTKLAASGGGRFSFEWSGLAEGLWALMTEGNSKGKSSVLSSVRAALQGRFPGRLKDDIWLWVDMIEVSFTIERVEYFVRVIKDIGEKSPQLAEATVHRHDGSKQLLLYQGPANERLEAAMADLFMQELGFDTFRAYRAQHGTVVEHGWAAMSAALFISGAGPAIFGDNLEDGLPLRLMQMFIGLPWVSTYTAVASAYKRFDGEKTAESGATARDRERVRNRVDELTALVEQKKTELAKLPDRSALRADLDKLDRQVSKSQGEVTDQRSELELARLTVDATRSGFNEARRLLQQANDEASAGYVFRKLQPACCPACEVGFGDLHFAAVEVETCGLCRRAETTSVNDEIHDTSSMKAAVADAESAYKTALKALAKSEISLAGAETARDDSLRKMRAVETSLGTSNNSEIVERDIAVLEGRLEELKHSEVDEVTPTENQDARLGVLKAAEKITKLAMEALQSELLGEVEKVLFTLAGEFGVSNLESLSLKSNRMDVRQGGADFTYGRLNEGEQLRMRIAAALATLTVAKQRGFGRHPGILVLDSPASAEMSHDDFAALIGAVNVAVRDLPGIQVLVGAVIRPELEPVVPISNRKEAKGSATLF